MKKAPWLDNQHVVFGKVIKNQNLIKKIGKYVSWDGWLSAIVYISDCGEINENSKEELS